MRSLLVAVRPSGVGRWFTLVGLWALLVPVASVASTTAPLPESDYETQSACAAPAPDHASCLALGLTPLTAAARRRNHPLGFIRQTPIASASAAQGSYGLRPVDLKDAYFPGEASEAPSSKPQTIAVVDAYNDPRAEADLKVYSQEFGLPECTAANGCFRQVNQYGQSTGLPFPSGTTELLSREASCKAKILASREACEELEEAQGWMVEISTDIEVAHAVCENCSIVLVEAEQSQYADLNTAEQTAYQLGATEISNSWGGSEPPSENPIFNHEGVVITASAGDAGYLNWGEKGQTSYFDGADYPASSPNVVAVGGTELHLSTGAWESETVWNENPGPDGKNHGATGGGCSAQFPAQPWQQAVPDWSQVGCGSNRAVADISADADPYTGVAVYDSTPDGKSLPAGWHTIGGTSVASPIIASMFALVGGANGVPYPAKTLYSHLGSSLLHDVTLGGSGKCKGLYTSCSGSSISPLDCGEGLLICNASAGYDGPTGVGTPNGLGALEPESSGPQTEGTGKEETKPKEEPQPQGEGGKEKPPAGESKETHTETTGPSPTGKPGEGSSPTSPGSGPQTSSSVLSVTSGVTPDTKPVPRISALALSRGVLAAIAHGEGLSRLSYMFTISAASRVRVKLARQVSVNGRRRWETVTPTVTLTASKGSNVTHMKIAGGFAPGRYLLTLSPPTGVARSITFRLT
jgi:hypothetical protein